MQYQRQLQNFPASHCSRWSEVPVQLCHLTIHFRMASYLRSLISKFHRSALDVTTTTARKMNMNSPDLPEIFLPPVNRSMQTTLDKSFFRKVVPLAAATVFDVKQITHVRKELDRSGDMLRVSPVRPLRDDDSTPGAKCFLLRPGIDAKGMSRDSGSD